MLDQKRIADVLENDAPSAGGPTVLRQLTGKRFDNLDHGRNLALVACQHHALGERVGDTKMCSGVIALS